MYQLLFPYAPVSPFVLCLDSAAICECVCMCVSVCLHDKTIHLKAREGNISCILCYVNSMNISKLSTHGESE